MTIPLTLAPGPEKAAATCARSTDSTDVRASIREDHHAHLREVPGRPEERYLLHQSRRPRPEAPLFVSVHGASRNASQHLQFFAPLLEEQGVTLVAPLFEGSPFHSYQRLRCSSGRRADRALERMVVDAAASTGHDPAAPFCLFGFSGGAQFAHRFALTHPHRVRRLALGSAGHYTFPRQDLSFPRGLRSTATEDRVELHLNGFLSIPTLVLVGERDIERDASLATSAELDRQQGCHRLERARRWVFAMRLAATHSSLPPQIQLMPLADVGHSFRRCMRSGGLGEKVMDFLYPPRRCNGASVVSA